MVLFNTRIKLKESFLSLLMLCKPNTKLLILRIHRYNKSRVAILIYWQLIYLLELAVISLEQNDRFLCARKEHMHHTLFSTLFSFIEKLHNIYIGTARRYI